MAQLTAADRGKIEILLQEHYTNKQIALILGKYPSTIGREIKKGLDGSGRYLAWIAQTASESNRKRCKQIPKLDHPANWRLRGWIVLCLQKGWNPSMISGRMKAEGFVTVCAETIYAWIYESTWAKPRNYINIFAKVKKDVQNIRADLHIDLKYQIESQYMSALPW